MKNTWIIGVVVIGIIGIGIYLLSAPVTQNTTTTTTSGTTEGTGSLLDALSGITGVVSGWFKGGKEDEGGTKDNE